MSATRPVRLADVNGDNRADAIADVVGPVVDHAVPNENRFDQLLDGLLSVEAERAISDLGYVDESLEHIFIASLLDGRLG